jgi:hypothetical protein
MVYYFPNKEKKSFQLFQLFNLHLSPQPPPSMVLSRLE